MFTGIVTEIGTVTAVEPLDESKRFGIGAARTCDGLQVGDSVAVNGVCLTVIAVHPGHFEVQAVAETLERSNLSAVEVGNEVDLERPMAADGRFDGHIVQGHVDGMGTVVSAVLEGDARRMRIGVGAHLGQYLVEKGSVAVDGVSLTLTAVASPREDRQWFEVVLIPHTLEHTVLGMRSPGDRVNIECDLIAKHVERIIGAGR